MMRLLRKAAELCQLDRRAQIDFIQKLNARHREVRGEDVNLEARIQSFELAYRMQLEATEALDLSDESPETLEMYGINEKETESFGRRCLLTSSCCPPISLVSWPAQPTL